MSFEVFMFAMAGVIGLSLWLGFILAEVVLP